MVVATHISVEEYLNTPYRPDRDFVDGEVIERNVGERLHAECALEIALYFKLHPELNIHVFNEWRMQVQATRFRVPDVALVIGAKPKERILTRPPFVAIEILSPEDRVITMRDRIDDYLGFGVRYVWIIDPESERAWSHTGEGSRESKDLVLRTENPEIALPLREIFETIR